ncbi:MAG: tetratricopeptide repeat protein [Planctomycetaceae bacterium]|nr:tetratricopeptide repeat protein [Planctomycetaceae bacterium]
MRDSTGVRAGGTFELVRIARGLTLSAVMMAAGGFVGQTFCLADATDDYNVSLRLYKNESWEPAVETLRAFLKAAPNHEKAPNAQLYLGQALVHLRRFDEARPVFREFVRNHTEHPDIDLGRYRVAECSYFLNDFPTARKEFAEFLDQAPAEHTLNEWALLYLGETELRIGNMQEAANAFEQLLAQNGDSALVDDARFGLARAYESVDRQQDAIALYRTLMENSDGPRAADAQFNLSARLFAEKQFAEAAASFEALVEKFPESGMVALSRLNAGFSRYHLGDHAAAAEAFAKIQDDPKYGMTARYWTGLSQKSLGQFDQAGETLLKAYREDESQPLAESMLFHAADSKLGAKVYEEAKQLFLTVVDKWPQGELADDALHSAVEAALLAGNVTEAEQIRRRFVEQYPNSGLQLPVELLHGRVLLARGDELTDEGTDDSREKAQQAYRFASQVFQTVLAESTIPATQTMARLQLARAYGRLKDHEQLVEVLDPLASRATADDASDDELRALVMQSNGWLSLEKYDRSLETARQYVARRPDGADAAEAYANISLALANVGEWDEAKEALSHVRETADAALGNRITYEVAELAYDADRFESAAELFGAVVQQGAEGEYYVPSVSGLAYSRHNEGLASLEAADALKEQGEQIDGTARLADALARFEDAATWFERLRELATGNSDAVVASNAAYMQGLSLRLAKRGEQATEVFLPAFEQFSLAADVDNPSEQQLKVSFNAFRIARDAARTFTELSQVAQAEKAYDAAYHELKKQPVERQDRLDVLINEWALLHYGVQDFDRAAELFTLLLDERPDSEWADDARLLIAENDYFSDRWEAARDQFIDIVRDDSTDDFVQKKALTLLVDSAVQLDDWEVVKVAATQLRDSFPDDKERWYAEYRLGESALRNGDPGGAESILSALQEHRNDAELAEANWLPSAWHLLAEAQLALKKYGAVGQTISTFKEEFPDSEFTYLFDDVQGRRFKNQAEFDYARQAFQRVIDSKGGSGTETAAKAQFMIGETWLTQANASEDDAEQAKRAYLDAFIAYNKVQQYDFPEWQAPALFQAGLCDEALKQWGGAKKSYEELIAKFPESEYAQRARQQLESLQKRFPDPQTP